MTKPADKLKVLEKMKEEMERMTLESEDTSNSDDVRLETANKILRDLQQCRQALLIFQEMVRLDLVPHDEVDSVITLLENSYAEARDLIAKYLDNTRSHSL